jgi:murein DD-endopeptidase MepM/ murein hydrolase activator NlpD
MAWREATLTIGDGQWGKGTVSGGPTSDGGVYSITSSFGPRETFIAGGYATAGIHQGLDIGYPEGVPLVALFDAEVTHVSNAHPSYGNYVIYSPVGLTVDDPGWCQIWLGHMRDITVQVGERVPMGGLVGHVGQTGMATGPHLHLEVRNRMGPIDPFNALMAGGLANAVEVPQPATPAEITTSLTYVPMTREAVITSLNTGALFVDLNPSTPAVVVFTGN